MAVGPEEFFKRIEESGLLNDSIVAQKDRLLAVASGEDAAADLVRQKLLTEYQSEVLVSGDQIPLVIGDYVVTDPIGRGGMGYVLKARHRRMKRTVAIKFLLKSLTESDDLRRRFEREVEAAAQLNHQNIVTAYDAGVHDGSHYLVMQYVDGDDLSHIVKSSGPLGISEAVDVIRQAALGLGYGLSDETLSIRMTGCPNGCTRPYVGEVGIVGKARDRYTLFLGGSKNGTRIAFPFRDMVPLIEIASALEAPLSLFASERRPAESFGDFCHRLGPEQLLEHEGRDEALRNPKTGAADAPQIQVERS